MARISILAILILLLVSFASAHLGSSSCALGKRGGTTAALVARACEPDGEDGSGGCDPYVLPLITILVTDSPTRCDDKCETNKRSLEDDNISIRSIHGNATVPWEEGEAVRWHILSARQTRQLVFNCLAIPEICVSP